MSVALWDLFFFAVGAWTGFVSVLQIQKIREKKLREVK
jgi:hypothetical protein